jgi:hypothetical protein
MARISLSKKSGTNSRGGISKTSKSSGGSSAPKQDLAVQLSAVASQAKSLGINTGKADSMLAQTKAEGSKSYAGSSYEKAYKASIPVTKLTPAADALTLPEAPKPVDPGNVVAGNNAGIASMLGPGYSVDANGQIVNTGADKGTSTDLSGSANIFQQYLAQKTAPPNMADIYNKEYKASGVKQAQQDVNNYTAQLNSIVAKSQADQLRLEGQGRGVTDVIIGGQQAQINREAAIAALPVQAQLSAAQGNLQMAQEHLDTMFKIKSQDALAQYQYKSNLLDSVYNFASGMQQKRLDALKVQEDRKYAEQQDFNKAQNAALSNALAQGAPASVYNAIKSATTTADVTVAAGIYNGDVLGRALQQEQLNQLRTKPAAVAKAPEVKSINGVDMQWNPSSGKWETIDTGGAGSTDTTNRIAKFDSLLTDIADARSMSGSVGAGWIERGIKSAFSSNPEYAQLQNISDTIKSNLLTMNTDPAIKKFFGPQMSNRDTELMMAAGSTLNPQQQTETQFLKDLTDASDLIIRARTALQEAQPQQTQWGIPGMTVDAMTPDGQEVIFIDK